MIRKIRGILTMRAENKIYLDVGNFSYEVNIPKTVYYKLEEALGKSIELIVYQYFQIDKNKSIPFIIGFVDEMEREFFEKFISVSGIGPRAALKAFDRPIALIAQKIEEGNVTFLSSLVGIGRQRAKQIVAHLQGKVGRFALMREEARTPQGPNVKQIVDDAKQILKRLQYSGREIEVMIKKALEKSSEVNTAEELLNLIYYENK